MSTTIGDVILQKQKCDQTQAEAKATAAAADQAYTDAQTAANNSNAQLKVALTKVGPAFIQNSDGSFLVYIPDSTDVGFQVIEPVAVGTPVDLGPAPTPTPTPAPDPNPTPVSAPLAPQSS